MSSDHTISQAAQHLGISENAVRQRIKRGTLPAIKVKGVWRVQLDDHEPTTRATSRDHEADQSADYSALVEAQQREIEFLRAELESRREADRETRILFSQMVSKLEALEAGQEATESPESDDGTEDEAEPVSRPWWRFWGH